MQSPKDILTDLWTLAGGAPSALDAVTLTGTEPVLAAFHVVTSRRPVASKDESPSME